MATGLTFVLLEPGPVAGPVALALAATTDAPGPVVIDVDAFSASYLGAIVDRERRVLEWLELRLQEPGRFAKTPAARQLPAGNGWLDSRWSDEVSRTYRLDLPGIVRTGWETRAPILRIDVDAGLAHRLADPDGCELSLCTDEAVLIAAGLPSYSTTAVRLLWSAGHGSPRFWSAAPEVVADVEEVAPRLPPDKAGARTFVWNIAGGGVMCRRFRPLDVETYSELLEGGRWEGVSAAGRPLPIHATLYDLGRDRVTCANRAGFLHLDTGDSAASSAELFYLKLALWRDAIVAVRDASRRCGMPLLNVDLGGFRVAIADVGGGLPLHWTAKAELARAGAAVDLALAGVPESWFIPATWGEESQYTMGAGVPRRSIRAGFVVEDLRQSDEVRLVVRGLVEPREHIEHDPSDLLILHLPHERGQFDLFVRPEARPARGGTIPVLSLGHPADPSMAAALRSMLGRTIERASFELLPAYDSAWDLYALGVVGIRLLLARDGRELPVALRVVKELARSLANSACGSADGERSAYIAGLLGGDRDLRSQLGAGRLGVPSPEGEARFGALPLECWCELLASLIACFSGAGRTWFASSAREAGALADHRVFDGLVGEVDQQLVQMRSLVAVDWTSNRELATIVRQVRASLA